MSDLTVALVQRELAWEDPPANRARIAADLATLAGGVDLIVLPEMFTTGFSMDAEAIAEPDSVETLPWMQSLAREKQSAVTGSLAVFEAGQRFNRLLFVTPDGAVQTYDKRHLFRMSGEHEHYAAGRQRKVFEWRGWRLCPMICYDLRFPVWIRNRDDYDALLFVANWPAKRAHHWRQLLIARAIENQACCIGVNRLGRDGNGIDYCGDSLAIAADGEILLDCEDAEGIFTAHLEREPLDRYRRKFPCHRDADDFNLALE